ncbi:MAG: flavin reductase family protein [Acholeplasmatales bacterium]|nr:MAG: flavin reductase family protein [Acholeplasmatales bacterium]
MTVPYYTYAETFLEQLPKGVFLTVQGETQTNTMTIAWGHIGVIWGKPTFIAYVRYSRHTYALLREAKDFTINVPTTDLLQEALKIAGTQSGRDIDKFATAKLTLLPAKQVKTPIIAECGLHYECRILYTQTQEPALIPEALKARYYPQPDTHIMFFGEIVDVYRLD